MAGSPTVCPRCKSEDIEFRPKGDLWRCDQCGHRWHAGQNSHFPEYAQRQSAATAFDEPWADEASLIRLPYPVALTAKRLGGAVEAHCDVLRTLFALKDCFEATVKYCGVVLLAEYFRSPGCTPERNAALLEKMVRPSLGVWVDQVVGDLSHWVAACEPAEDVPMARVFADPPTQKGGRAQATSLLKRCKPFVSYRNDALGHGAMRPDRAYAADLAGWLPVLGQLLAAVVGQSGWRLCLVTDMDRYRSWMGLAPAEADEPGSFRREQVGHFVLCGPQLPLPAAREGRSKAILDLYPFLCYLPDAQQQQRLHFYDSVYRYQQTRKEVQVLEYDEGFKHNDETTVAGLEEAFTAELLSAAFKRHQGRMEVIEGRVANFGELIVEHAEIVGRRFAIDRVKGFIRDQDRGLLVIEAEPGKGKTALMAHLVEHVFGHYSPPPVHFFYRRTAGITDPDVCVKSLYASLLEAHNITEAEESQQRASPEEIFNKLVNLLAEQIAPRLSPQRSQLIFVDALDEAELTPAGRTAFQRLPENLPAGVYVIASTRPVVDRTSLARRPHLHWYNLDDPELLQANLSDSAEYVQRELAASALPNATLSEIARTGRGNFLVLKLLCGHVRTRLESGEVGDFLRRLSTGGAEDQLGFIYEEFWNRLTGGLTREDNSLLCDVAGLLVMARAPLSAEVLCDCLKLRAGGWDFALRHLTEYLTIVQQEFEGEQEAYYRIYHESFAEFLRVKLATDRQRYENLLADYCLRWSGLAQGRGRLYALRFGPSHVLVTGRWEALESLLTDLLFLETKTEAGMVFELAEDFSIAVKALPEDRPQRSILSLLEEAIRRDIQFIAGHAQDYPQGLFQCLWNGCWWYDATDAARHYEPLDSADAAPPSTLQGPNLHQLLERWRKERQPSGRPWSRSLRPPATPLGSPLRLHLRCQWPVRVVAASRDGRWVGTGSADGVVSIWDAVTGQLIKTIQVMAEAEATFDTESGEHVCFRPSGPTAPSCLIFSPDGQLLASGHEDSVVHIWDVTSGAELDRFRGNAEQVTSLVFSLDGKFLAVGGSDSLVRIWDRASRRTLSPLEGHEKRIVGLSFLPDGVTLASVSSDWIVRLWDVQNWRERNLLTLVQEDIGAGQHGHHIEVMGFSPTGRHLAVASRSEHCLTVWDIMTSKMLLRLHEPRNVYDKAVQFISDEQLATAGEDRVVRVWNLRQQRLMAEFPGHNAMVVSLAYIQQTSSLISGSPDCTAIVWDTKRIGPTRRLRDAEPMLVYVSFSQYLDQGRFLATAGSRDVKLWDPQSGIVVGKLQDAEAGNWLPSCLAVRPGKEFKVATGGEDERVRIWDLSPMVSGASESLTLQPQWRSDPSGGQVECIEFSPDGRYLAWGGRGDNVVRVSCINDSRNLIECRGHFKTVRALAFSSSGELLASASQDRTVRLWVAATGATEAWFSVDRSESAGFYRNRGKQVPRDWSDVKDGDVGGTWFVSVAISPDGRWLAAGTDDKTYGSRVYLWDLSRVVTDYERPLQLLGHKGQIDSLIFSDDSRLLASGSEDNTVRVWEVCSGRCLYSIGLRNATLQVFNASTRDGWQRFVEGRTTQLRLGKVPSQSVWLPWTPDITPNPSDPTLWAGPDYPSSNIVFFRIENT